MPITTLEIAGSPVSMAAANLWPARMTLRLRGISTLTLVRNGGPLLPLPDPWLGKPVVLKVDGTPVFAGDVSDVSPGPSEYGWTAVYACRGLRARGDRVAYTDSNSLMDESRWNYDPEDEDKIDSRLGRTVGQILADALMMEQNAEALWSKGIGGYTSFGPPTLPAATLADLAAMTLIPPSPVAIGGDRLLGAIEAFLTAWAPNHAMWVRPDGVIRFLDLRSVSEHVLTLDDCDGRLEPSPLTRSIGECFTRVVVRGRTVAEGKLLSLAAETLEELFAYDALDNAAAKAAYDPADFLEDEAARSMGTLSVTDLTHVVLTSDPTTQAWGMNEWDQSSRKGRLFLTDTAGSGINYVASSRIVANTAKSSGGTSTVTLETALPGTAFDSYFLYGLSSGASLVYRKYRAVDPDIRAALARRMTYPVPYVLAGGGGATLTSYPMGSVLWSTSGSPPYNEFPVAVTVDPSDGTFLFAAPTYNVAGREPADVRVLAAVNTAGLTAVKPATGFEGTAFDVEGVEETLTVTVDSWRDPANQANVEAFCADLLDSVKDAVVEGSVTLHRMFAEAFDFGLGISIEGNGYPTGWEALNLPVVEVDVVWNSRAGSHYTTTLQVSNRRANYSVSAFLQPERRPGDGTLGFAQDVGFMPYSSFSDSSYSEDGGDNAMPSMEVGGIGGDSYNPGGFDLFDIGPMPTSAKDPRSPYDRTSARDPNPARDPRSARDDTPAGERPYDPERKYSTPGRYSTPGKYDKARKFDAPDRDSESQARRQAAADRKAVSENRRQANAAASDGPSRGLHAAKGFDMETNVRHAAESQTAKAKAQEGSDRHAARLSNALGNPTGGKPSDDPQAEAARQSDRDIDAELKRLAEED